MRLARAELLHPVLQFRYTIISSELEGAAIFARGAQQPSFNTNPIKADYQNGYFFVAGKKTWEPITLRCYHYEGITMPNFWRYVQRHQTVKLARDTYANSYKHTLRLTMLSPDGLTPVGTWKLVGAFFQSVKFGDMDWGGEEVTEIDATIVYDFAEYSLIF
jgi:hypothetical protein